MELKAYHHSHEEFYRSPFGAVPCGQVIRLRITVQSSVPVLQCDLRVWEEKESREQIFPMVKEEYQDNPQPGQVFGVEYPAPAEPGLVWYYFRLQVGEELYYYGNNGELLGGEGVLLNHEPSGYQITVFKPRQVPAWYKQGIMYQIFVDRFHPGEGPLFSHQVDTPARKKGLLHLNWNDNPFYIRDEQGRIERWAFFGGNLTGIIAKLDYLRELGVSIVYLNPIFEAPSNHKYDTGDYHKIDPMYGDEAIFRRLVREADKRGIRIILDGVFSHTGADSIYFNKYGNYPGTGAYQSPESPYYEWYLFREYPHDYESWWGVDVLPNVNEMVPSYRQFIYGGEDSVVKYWVKAGAKGWRLDVADELPDEFIKELRQSLKETDPEAVLIGEVWEDATNKISYGKRREYLWGEGLDATMNYPLRQIWLDFLLGKAGAYLTHRRVMSLYENYPRENFYAAMNLIGSHDRVRILTLLGEAPPEDSLSEKEKEEYRLPPQARELAVRRLKLMAILQMTFPGVPCIYYGDEAGLEGYADPYNRGTYPWGREDQDLLDWYRRAAKLRREYEVLIHGDFRSCYADEDIYGFRRQNHREAITVLINRNCRGTKQVKISSLFTGEEAKSRMALDLWAGAELEIGPDGVIELPPLSAKVLYFRKDEAKIKTIPLPKAAGILLPVTSLPGSFGIGDLGKGAYRFVDFLVSAGQKVWQILPLNPLGLGNSPYFSPSAFAGNELLIDLEGLAEAGFLTAPQLQEAREEISGGERLGRVDYRQAREVKEKLLKEAYRSFKARCPDRLYRDYLQFRQDNSYWLEDYCLFMALKKEYHGAPWYDWEPAVARREGPVLEKLKEKLTDRLDYYRFLQYIFSLQWQKLKVYANSQGIAVFGDLPIYVAPDSCDTWSQPRLFCLTETGKPGKIAGVPPDYFSPTGQLWGNPIYNWEEHARQGYEWWISRLRHSLTLVDYLRLDHFRGFEAYWEVPGERETAAEGNWQKGPGKEFFEVLYRTLGPLPLIAEDLGYLTPEVYNLKHLFQMPGMKVFQFTPEEMLAQANPRDIFYTGTHDNDTLPGWCRENQQRLAGLVGSSVDGETNPARKVIELLYKTDAPWVIVPLQDILGLGPEARMNTPGTAEGNWEWQFQWEQLTEDVTTWLGELALASGR